MSISFARVAGTSTTFAATNAYTAVTPGATSSSTATGGGGLTGQDVTDYYLLVSQLAMTALIMQVEQLA